MLIVLSTVTIGLNRPVMLMWQLLSVRFLVVTDDFRGVIMKVSVLTMSFQEPIASNHRYKHYQGIVLNGDFLPFHSVKKISICS